MSNMTPAQVDDLLKTLKSLAGALDEKNGAGSFGGLGMSGPSNRSLRSGRDQSVEVLGESLKELHLVMKSGGSNIRAVFKDLATSINPLKKALLEMEDVVEDITETYGDSAGKIAKKTEEYIKTQDMGVDALTKMSKEHNEYRELIGKVAALKSKDIRQNRAASLELIKRLRELEKLYGDQIGMIPDLLKMQMKSVETNSKANVANAKTVKAASEAMQSFGSNIEHSDRVIKTWMGSIKKSTQEYQKAMQDSIKNLGTKLMSGISADLKRFPGMASARRQAGVEHYNATQTALMGLSQQEGLRFQSANREAINAITQFGQQGDVVADGRMGNWMRELQRRGNLVGADGAAFLAGNMNAAYRTGRGFDDQQNIQMYRDAQRNQQLWNFENIQEASNAWNDYATQIYNVQKFNRINQIQDKRQRAIELNNLNDEMHARMELTKAMGLEVEYIKQKEQSSFESGYKSFGDQIRQMVHSQLAAQSISSEVGLTDKERRLLALAQTSFDSMSVEDQTDAINAQNKFLDYYDSKVATRNKTLIGGGSIGDAMIGMSDLIVPQMAFGQAGFDIMGESKVRIAARAKANAQGNLSPAEIGTAIDTKISKLDTSATNFSGSVENFATAVEMFVKGVGGSMMGGIISAVTGGVSSIINLMIYRRLGGGFKALEGLIKGGRGAQALGWGSRLAPGLMGGAGAATTATAGAGTAAAGAAAGTAGGAGLTAAGLAGGTLAVGAAGLGGYAIGTGLSKWGEAAYYSDNSAAKAATVILNPLGYGATAISDYFSTKSANNLEGITERVSKTGKYTQSDIDAFVKNREVGDWWVTDSERKANTEDVTKMLEMLVTAYNRRQSSVPNAPQTSGANITSAYDAANGIQRDANGRPIAGVDSNREVLEEIAKNTGSQVAIAQQAHTETKQFRETQSAIAAARGLHDSAMASLDAALAQAMT